MKFNMDEEHKIALQRVRKIYDFISQEENFSKLIPEVRTNISVSIPNPKSPKDIAAIDGRITIVNGIPKACGDIKFGASDHTARLLLTAKKYNNEYNIVMNLKYIATLIKKIETSTRLNIIEVNRMREPEEIKDEERSTMQWLIKEVVHKKQKVPDIIWDKGKIGKESMMRLFAENEEKMIQKLKIILKLPD
ncbi:MAG: hypothetical protein EU548_02320 [Promethearchaeota archaeon]|nr:MAG: hypothetical protein EU548_02320 [Candidatus Lokiarchaeota archaeon]